MEREKEKNENTNEEKQVKITTIIYVALIIISAIILFFGILIYGFGKSGELVKKAEKLIPYPAVVINNANFISIRDINENLDSVKKFYESQDFSKIEMRVDFSTENGKKRLKLKEKEILNRMVEDRVIEIIAKQKGITVFKEMVDQNLERKLEEYGSGNNLKNNLDRLYGWTVQDFKDKIVRPDIYSQELEKIFLSQDPSYSEAKSLIEKAREELEKKKIFSEVAKIYSQGSTAQEGGELGWFKKDQLIPDISETVFSLAKGKRSEILESPLGFHIVEVEDKKTENGEELVRIRQIFSSKKTFAEFLTEEMKKMKFLVLFKDYLWDREKTRVEFESEEMKNFEKELIENSQGDASIIF